MTHRETLRWLAFDHHGIVTTEQAAQVTGIRSANICCVQATTAWKTPRFEERSHYCTPVPSRSARSTTRDWTDGSTRLNLRIG